MTPRTAASHGDARSFWNQRYSESDWAYGQEANTFLQEQAAALPPGDALCLAEGQGRNAVFLARLGHRVIAQDLSAVGLNCAQQLASSQGVSLQTLCCDLAAFEPEACSTDLVVAIWMHLPVALRQVVHRRAVAALRPGGRLILEAYAPEQRNLGTGGPPVAELLIDPDDLRHELAGLELELFRTLQRWIDEGPYHHGESAVVQVVGRKPSEAR